MSALCRELVNSTFLYSGGCGVSAFTATQWVVKDTTGKVHRPTFKFIKGKYGAQARCFASS